MKSILYILSLGLLCSFILIPSSADLYALSDTLILFQEIPTVYSALKIEQPITEVPAAVTVINRNEIDNMASQEYVDIFRRVSGLDMFVKTYSDQDLSIRGFAYDEAPKTLILIDGHKINSPYHHGMNWPQLPFSMDNVQRVEIIKGPVSALYGTDAFAGLINFITIPVEDRTNLLRIGYGEDGYQHINSRTVIKKDPVNFSITVGKHMPEKEGIKDTDDYDNLLDWQIMDVATKDQIIIDGNYIANSQKRLDYSLRYAKTQGGYNSSPDSAGAQKRMFNEHYYAFARYESPLFMDGKFNSIFTYAYEYRHNLVKVNGETQWSPMTFETEDIYVTKPVEYTFINQVTKPYGNHLLIGGVEYGLKGMEATYFTLVSDNTYEESLLSFYLQDKVDVSDKLEAVLGGRYDKYELADDAIISPKGSVVYKASDDSSVFLSVGGAFREPMHVEKWYWVAGFSGNPEIKPETIISYEAGFKKNTDKLNMQIAGFYEMIEDMIGYAVGDVPSMPGTQSLHFDNVANGYAYGGEVDLKYQVNDKLSSFLNYSYQAFFDDDTDDQLEERPEHKANLGITKLLPSSILMDLYVQYVGESHNWTAPAYYGTDLDAYTNLNMSIQKKISVDDNELTLAISVYNLLDENHYEYPGYSELSRKIMGSVKYEF
ncbi:TonB-dependent receptor plug domain-containing protein [Elusimicrobiota bacterium]